MAKHWYMQFDVNADLADTASLSLMAVGFWKRVVGVMWKNDRCGKLVGSYATIARVCMCKEEEAKMAIAELEMLHVTDCNVDETGNVTLINRRMYREYNERKASNERVIRHREKMQAGRLYECNAEVTVHSNSNSNSNSKQQQQEPKPAADVTCKTPTATVASTPTPAPAPRPADPEPASVATGTAAAAAVLKTLGVDTGTVAWAEAGYDQEAITAAVERFRVYGQTRPISNPSALIRKLLSEGCAVPQAATGRARASPGASVAVVETPAQLEARRVKRAEEQRLQAEHAELEKTTPLAEMLRKAALAGQGKTRAAV